MVYSLVKVKEVAHVHGGKRLPIGHSLTKEINSHPYIRARDIDSGKITFNDPVYIDENTFSHIKNYIVHKDDVCITIVGANVGDIGFVPEELDGANLTENAVKLSPKNNKFNKKFLKYCLITDNVKLQMKQLAGGGSAQPKLGLYKINGIEIPNPNIKLQNSIAFVLSTYDDLIENNEKRIKILEELAQRLYTEWFVRFKFPGHEKVKMFDSETEFREIPKGWEVKRLSDLIIPQYGYTTSAVINDSLPKFLRGTDINKKSYIDWSEVPNGRISDNDFKKYEVKSGDIFIIRMADPGKIAINESRVNAIFASYLMRLNIKSKLTPYFLYYFLTSEKYQNFINGASNGSTRKGINSQLVGAINILIPPDLLLKDFESKVGIYRNLLSQLVARNYNLSQTRDLLIPQLVTGKKELK